MVVVSIQCSLLYSVKVTYPYCSIESEKGWIEAHRNWGPVNYILELDRSNIEWSPVSDLSRINNSI